MPKDPYLEEEEGKEEGNFEEDVYTKEGREELLEEDEINETEEGFAEGFEHGETEIQCQNCGKILTDENVVEREFEKQPYFFCSDTCAEDYLKKRRKQPL